MEYLWDKVGNLTQRKDLNRSLTEDFVYDDLHRLDQSLLNQSQNLDLSYDAMGNITSRSDVGGGATWTYDATKKHAVTQAGSNTYTYDDNGNQITRNSDNVDWTSYNYPEHIENGSEHHDFFYDANRQRWKREYFDGSATETTIYVGGLLEKKTFGAETDYRHYIYAGGEPVSVYTRQASGSAKRRIFLLNHQSSIAASTVGSTGNIEVEEDFSAFGERRDPNDWDGPPSAADLATINLTSERGYTFHSNLEESALIHMNGRVGDAMTGRFLSPDPFIPDPGNTQAFNRYSYVYNNPLSYTDPSGFTPCPDPLTCIDIFTSVLSFVFGGLFGSGSSAPPPPPPGCYGWAVSCFGFAPTNTGVFVSDVYDLPLANVLEQLMDLYTCSQIMNNPLSCLFGSPIGGGIGVPVAGGSGFGTGVCPENIGPICMSVDDSRNDVDNTEERCTSDSEPCDLTTTAQYPASFYASHFRLLTEVIMEIDGTSRFAGLRGLAGVASVLTTSLDITSDTIDYFGDNPRQSLSRYTYRTSTGAWVFYVGVRHPTAGAVLGVAVPLIEPAIENIVVPALYKLAVPIYRQPNGRIGFYNRISDMLDANGPGNADFFPDQW